MNKNNQDQDQFKRAYNLVIKHYWHVSLQNWKTGLPGLLLPALGNIFIVYIPALAVAKIVNIGTSNANVGFDTLLPYIFIFAGSWLMGEICWRIGLHFAVIAQTRAVDTIYNNGLSALLRRDINFFHDNFAGSLTKKTIGYATRYIDVTDTMIFNIVSQLVPVLFACVILSTYSPWLAISLVLWIGLTVALILPLIRRRRKLVDVREESSNVVSGHIADVYGNMDAVRAYASEKREEQRHKFYVADLVRKTKHSWDFQNRRIDTVVAPLYVLTNTFGLVFGLFLAQNGSIAFTALIVIFTYYFTVTNFMWEFNSIYRRLESAIGDAAQYTELLLIEPSITDPVEPVKMSNIIGKIHFDKVCFRYEENSNELFDNFSLEIKAGQKVGLVGHSGGGKTSVTKLLLRFADIDSGSITIDGIDIRHITQADLRSFIAYVPQEPAMFHRSLKENIAYGKPEATDQEIIDAAKKAHAHEFIKDLPDGYETLVGERGIKLSGGQRQRVAIARAMLKNAPILVLDEATSALDSESEKLIQDALWKLMEGKTAIVIAHRLSTIQKMDRILVLEEGEIIEDGSHQELLKNDGIYSELWKHQSGGFLED